MVKTYDEWKAACENEHFRLSEMSYYLNPNGKERMLAFGLLLNLTGYCDSGKERLDWIDTKDGLQKEDIKLLETGHAQQNRDQNRHQRHDREQVQVRRVADSALFAFSSH